MRGYVFVFIAVCNRLGKAVVGVIFVAGLCLVECFIQAFRNIRGVF